MDVDVVFFNIILIAILAFPVPPSAIQEVSVRRLTAWTKIELISFFRDDISNEINFGTKMEIDPKCRD